MFQRGSIAGRIAAIAGVLAVVLAGAWLFLAYENGVALERDFRAANRNEIPDGAARALASASKVTLYSLEPWAKAGTREHLVLGQVDLTGAAAAKAVAAFQSTVASKVLCSGFFRRECHTAGVALCFNPRHELRVVANGQSYEFLLCYQCHRMEVFQNGRPVAALAVTGSPKVLNDLLEQANIPLAKSADQDTAAPS
jgi:hypothetical protein